MRIPLLAACLSIGTLSGTLTTAGTPPLEVMLQGSSAAALADLVERVGGTVTHELHIIDAVGATLTKAQLDETLQSGLVTRHIDDLSMSAPPDPEPKDECKVSGALELGKSNAGFSWRVHNKGQQAASLESLKLHWPDQLGQLEAASLNGTVIKLGPPPDGKANSADLIPGKGVASVPPGSADLLLKFTKTMQTQDSPTVRQRDFSIEAGFDSDCTTELIPGYDDNHEDFYYSTVAGATALHQHGVTGSGVTVAVLDSGLWEHPLLANDSRGENRVTGRYDAIHDIEGKEVFDESGHGTHMTSVLAHSGPVVKGGKPTGAFKGIAPDVNLVAVKAFNEEGQGGFLDIVRGVQWVVDHQEAYNIRILNLSFAARPRWDYWLDPINQAIMRAWAKGITVVAAAGNEGPDAMSIGSPGNLPYIITVGAVTDSWTVDNRDDDYIPDFSSRGPTPNAHIKPDIVAPGGHITGLTRPGSTLTREHPEYLLETGEFVMTGSSQASAVVAGIAALLLQLEPDLSPDDVKCKLISSAEPAINSDGLLAYSPFQQGHGYASATRAVTLGEKGCANPDLDIQRDIGGSEHFQGPAIFTSEGKTSLPGLEHMLSPAPAAKGYSKIRKWGAKDHIESNVFVAPAPNTHGEHPFDWPGMYERERAAIEALSSQAQ